MTSTTWYADKWELIGEADADGTSGQDRESYADTSEHEATIARLRAEMAAVQEERDKAQKALGDFRTLVRGKVIEEADARGWCSEVDEWLGSLGLEERNSTYGLPTGRYAVVTLSNNRIAVLRDDDEIPWRIYDGTNGRPVDGWRSFKFVADRKVAVIFEGDDDDEWDPDNY